MRVPRPPARRRSFHPPQRLQLPSPAPIALSPTWPVVASILSARVWQRRGGGARLSSPSSPSGVPWLMLSPAYPTINLHHCPFQQGSVLKRRLECDSSRLPKCGRRMAALCKRSAGNRHLSALTGSNEFIVLDEDREAVRPGERVDFLPMQGFCPSFPLSVSRN